MNEKVDDAKRHACSGGKARSAVRAAARPPLSRPIQSAASDALRARDAALQIKDCLMGYSRRTRRAPGGWSPDRRPGWPRGRGPRCRRAPRPPPRPRPRQRRGETTWQPPGSAGRGGRPAARAAGWPPAAAATTTSPSVVCIWCGFAATLEVSSSPMGPRRWTWRII